MDTHMDHDTTPGDLAVIDQIKAEHHAAATKLLSALPQSRELSVALTKLEEAMLWAVQTVAVHGAR